MHIHISLYTHKLLKDVQWSNNDYMHGIVIKEAIFYWVTEEWVGETVIFLEPWEYFAYFKNVSVRKEKNM